MKRLFTFVLVALLVVADAVAWGSSDKVKLKDVEVLTLRVGHFTTGRRSSPVPQIKCVGGTAGCGAFVPQVVQCYNRGFDGNDIQWECKADMDNSFRFGEIAVTCEGYDYPDDPYILKGSCGLEYTIDYTNEGYAKKGQSSYSHSDNTAYIRPKQKNSLFSLESLTLVIGISIIVYAIYKTCIAPADPTHQRSTTNDDYPGRPDFGSRPPPYGFNVPNSGGDSCGSSSSRAQGSSGTSSFWTGAATGGLLGYMFGASNSGNRTGYGFGSAPRSSYGYDSWGTSSGGSYSASQPGPSTSSGSRSASGFGGTRRR